MAVYVVTWNLNRERANYDAARKAFVDHLDRYENIADRLDSTRWVKTDLTAHQLSKDLQSKMDSNDRLFVCKVNATQRAGWLSKKVWEWLQARGA